MKFQFEERQWMEELTPEQLRKCAENAKKQVMPFVWGIVAILMSVLLSFIAACLIWM